VNDRPDIGSEVRRVAAAALVRIDRDGAYANLVLPRALARSRLGDRDRGFVTELVYGTTRMRRACDWLVDRHLHDPAVPVEARALLRLGAYQLVFLDTPAHAAVAATVGAAPRRLRGLVNAVLRKVAGAHAAQRLPSWPDDATRLSYPDWLVERLTTDLGATEALAALETMNRAATVTERDDGYIQDRGSQWVVDHLAVGPGERVLDVCAAPGGKATLLASRGADVTALELHPSRARLIVANTQRLGLRGGVHTVVADGQALPVAAASADAVLLDAPCSGLGSLRRRPDARWRVEAADVERLGALQIGLARAALGALRPGGVLAYSVCTLTAAETLGVDDALAATHPELEVLPAPGPPWRPHGRGALLTPQAADTDGMYLLVLHTPGPGTSPGR
jgi:16S rRNA (cytosine967-C5)-methyltransferase